MPEIDDFLSQFEPLILTAKQEILLQIQDEMRESINDLALLYAQAWHGFALLREHLAAEEASLLNQIAAMSSAEEAADIYATVSRLPIEYQGTEQIGVPSAIGTLRRFQEAPSPNEHHLNNLGTSLLIALYQKWEDTWRSRIAHAAGIDHNAVLSDFWGDVRYLRIALIHKRGIATADVENKTKLFNWFAEGQPVIIDAPKFFQMIQGARAYCLSFPATF